MGLQWTTKSAVFLMLTCAVQTANSQGCVNPSDATLRESAREARQASARTELGKDTPLIEVRHCVGNAPSGAPGTLTAIETREGPVWLTSSTFVYQPYAISGSEFALDVVRCAGYATEYSCEVWTESHYFRGELSFSVRLIDGVGGSLATRIVDATMNRPCGPNVPEAGGRLLFLDRLEIGRGEGPGEYWIGTWGCAINLRLSDEELCITGMRARVE